MNESEFINLCKSEIVKYVNNSLDVTDKTSITEKDVYVVWNCKTLQNNKALLSTTLPDGMYYECTFNGDKQELYFDAYKKWFNKCISVNDNAIKSTSINQLHLTNHTMIEFRRENIDEVKAFCEKHVPGSYITTTIERRINGKAQLQIKPHGLKHEETLIVNEHELLVYEDGEIKVDRQ